MVSRMIRTVALVALVYLLLVSGCSTTLKDLQDQGVITAEQALYIQEEVADAVNERVGDAAWEGWLPIAGIIGLGGLWGRKQFTNSRGGGGGGGTT
jgi:hypothetical protein